MTYITEPLNADHDRSTFSCGHKSIDQFLKTYALQHMQKSHASVAFVSTDQNKRVQGFYTLSNDGIPYTDIPDVFKKKLPRFKSLGVLLIGQLAVDRKAQKNSLGTKLLMDAFVRCYDYAHQHAGAIAVVVDPIDDRAAAWYRQFGFMSLPDQTRLFLPMKTIATLFSRLKR